MSNAPSERSSLTDALDHAGGLSRGALGRDLFQRFLPLSFALHFFWALPWAAILTALLKLLGMKTGDVHWKDVDAPTVIPIDLDFDEGPVEAPNPPEPAADPTKGPGADAGLVAETSVEAGPSDGGNDAAPKPDAGSETGDAGGPPRVKDPNALAGGLAAFKPPNKEVYVSMLVRMDHLRTHFVGKQLGSRLLKIGQWRPFFDGTGIDPVRDFDAMFVFGPRFYETSRVSAIIVHNKPDLGMTVVMQDVSKRLGGEWIGDEEVPAFRAKIDGAPRVMVQIPGGLIVTPPDGEKQSLELAHNMVRKHKKINDALPKTDSDLIVSAFVAKPSNVLTAIPDDLHDVHLTVRRRKDDGGSLDMDAKAKDAKTAKEDVETIKKLIDSFVPKGLIGMVARKYVDGYTVTADGDVLLVHHELDGDKVESVWGLLTAGGF